MGATLAVPRPVGVQSGISGAQVFRGCLALYIAVVVTRIQEVVPGLSHFYLGKLAFLPMIAATLVALPRWQLLHVLRTTPGKCVIVLMLLGLLSIPLSIWPANSANFYVFVLMPELVLFVAVSAGFADERAARLCVVTLVSCAALDALYLASGLAPNVRGRAYICTGLDPNESAALFVCMLPFVMMLASERGRTRLLGLAAAPLFVVAIVKTLSRGGLVGLIVIGAITLIQAISKRRWGLVAGTLVCAGAFALSANETIAQRFQTMLEPETDYNVNDKEGRLEVWRRGVGYMASHPILGVGIASFETAEGTLGAKANEGHGLKYTAAHNAFVQIGAELGIFGLAAFITAFWSSVAGCRRVRRLSAYLPASDPLGAARQANLASALIGMMAAITTTGFFLSFAYHPLTLFPIAACAGVVAGAARTWEGATR